MKIALGTTSESKRKYLEEVLEELQISAEIESIDVDSGVSEQPLNNLETRQGSIHRARKAIKKSHPADFGLGIEIGYHPNKNDVFEMFCWASIDDSYGKSLSAQSHKIRLPFFHQQVLKEKKYLGDHVCKFLAENPDSVSQHIGIIIRDREPFIKTAVKSALIYYLQK